MSETQTIALPETLDMRSAQSLRDQLAAARGAPATLDGSAVRRLGALGLQVLLSAERQWQADGQPLSLVDPSPDLRAGLKLLGIAESQSFLTGA
ncbi:chemotaxis protein CheX [Caulobacter ginsengisoli]|uniref:Chemotaxis protein CheX n=1 Tax=Caulobacter ginsengisoli TaxID=400775 RepID=A0ABU0IW21_9CAUL|nr:STAS domain-containing protein [Caulobacter ginsengisoli]MDQ0465541.1 chemotaxis protein CheX [Caulobacter ginsengisoli]